jgi:hypothetical protein
MATGLEQKRYQRLGWPTVEAVGLEVSLGGVDITPSTTPKILDDFDDIRWDKSARVFDHSVVAIKYFALEDCAFAKSHAQAAVHAADDFFFGPWRFKTYNLEDGECVNADSLRREYNWINPFETALLWTPVLGEWDFLKKLGTFPKPDSHTDSDFGPQYRDLYVALGAFFCEAEGRTLNRLLEKASSGPKTRCKLMVTLIRAAQARDAALLQKGLIELLKHFKKSDFPKNLISKKICMEGTLFVHWAEKEKLPLTVPPEFADHIVRLQ